MRKLYTILASLLLGASSLTAQSYDVGGTVLNNDIIGWFDIYNLSFTSHNYGTARSMAMGNAFTALGADMISASLNPAGIGMYVDSDFSITPMMQFTKSHTKGGDDYYAPGTPKSHQRYREDLNRFGMSSAGAVFTVLKSTGAVTNINVGFAYNRIADFNQNMRVASIGESSANTIANLFCNIGNVDGLVTNDDGTMPFGGDPFYWGSTLAYKNGVINKDDQGWFIDRIGSEAEIDQYNAVQTRGSIGEYALTIGFNLMDKIYIGASLGLQSLDYRREVFYGEDYIYTEETLPTGEGTLPPGEEMLPPGEEMLPSVKEMPYQLTYMNYQQNTHISGMGVNLKFGITARPVNWLRIGVAYHSPTWYDANFQYCGSMWSETYSAGDNPEEYTLNRNGYFHDDVSSPVLTDEGPHGWNFRSPSRLLTGVAVTIGRRVILSADYERSWYQTNRLESSPIQGRASGYTPTFKDVFKGSNTVRVGAEAYILPFLPIRVGYIWNGSTLRDGYEDIVASHPMVTEQWFATAGFGIKFSESLYLDFAYQYGVSKQSKYQSFYGYYTDSEGNIVDEFTTESRLYSTHTNRHHAVLTLGFRF